MKRVFLAIALFLVFTPASIFGAAEKKDLELKASDGVSLMATYYSPGKPGPGMILLHQCNMDRKSWDVLATALMEKGVHVLTLDYRGYGESGQRTDNREEMQKLREKWPGDVDVAFAALRSQSGVDPNRLAAGGASCGVNQSVQLARRSGAIKALLFLSGGTGEEGIAYLRGEGRIPIFAAVSKEEERIVEFMRQVTGSSGNPATRMEVLTGAGHGVPMFAKDANLQPAIVEWIVLALK